MCQEKSERPRVLGLIFRKRGVVAQRICRSAAVDGRRIAVGERVVISPTNWYNTSAGGVGYLNSFKLSTDTPVFVFTAQLGTGEKAVAECCSHETGHSVGLYHDGLSGTTPTEYYKGQGNWAPIMGNSYSRAVTQWSLGEYTNASNTADDTAIIATYLPVSDDHGNSPATATVLSGPTVSDGGAALPSSLPGVRRSTKKRTSSPFSVPLHCISWIRATKQREFSLKRQSGFAERVSCTTTSVVTKPAGATYA